MTRVKWILGLLLVVVGIPVFPLPIPLGVPLIAGGLILMAQGSTRTRRMLSKFLQRFPNLYHRIHPHLGEEDAVIDVEPEKD